MEKEQIIKVLNLLQKNEKESTHILFNGVENEPIMLGVDKFNKIEGKSGTIAFIDGGNAEILKSSSFSVHFVRVFCTIYNGRDRVKTIRKEFFAVVIPNIKEGKQMYDVNCIGSDMEFSFDANDETLKQGKYLADISSIGGVVRRFSELNLADEVTADLIVIDGDLVGGVSGEDELLGKLKLKNVCGMSKTCGMITNSGENGLHAVRKISPLGSWCYYPLFKSELEICFVRLHPKSKYVFRIDSFRNIKENCGLLVENATDPIFLGYPYGLIEADKFARVTNQEKEYLRMKFMVSAGEKWEEISKLLKSNDAHNILDTVS